MWRCFIHSAAPVADLVFFLRPVMPNSFVAPPCFPTDGATCAGLRGPLAPALLGPHWRVRGKAGGASVPRLRAPGIRVQELAGRSPPAPLGPRRPARSKGGGASSPRRDAPGTYSACAIVDRLSGSRRLSREGVGPWRTSVFFFSSSSSSSLSSSPPHQVCAAALAAAEQNMFR